MSRLTASLLLVVLLAGVFAPAATALSPEPPHACCLRKTPHCHHSETTSERSLQSRSCAQHSCCRSVAGSQWGHAGLRTTREPVFSAALTTLPIQIPYRAADVAALHSVRAPPLA
jgi:hypothetical protein